MKYIVAALPVIFTWGYFDTQKDIENLAEGQRILSYNQELLEDRYNGNYTTIGALPRISEAEKEIVKIKNPLSKQFLNVVKTDSKINYDNLDLFCMAKNIYHEAGIEDRLGKYAVAQVTLNRLHSGIYPEKICDVVMQPFQFSWANNRSIRWTHPRGPKWDESKEIAYNVIVEGHRVNGLQKALFYHADYVSPDWKKPEAKITKIGTHIFYTSAR